MKNLNKRALLVSSDNGWEGLWIDKKLIKQYHQIEEGMDRGLLFIAISQKYNLTTNDFQTAYANKKANKYLELGSYPEDYETLITIIDFNDQEDLEYILSFL